MRAIMARRLRTDYEKAMCGSHMPVNTGCQSTILLNLPTIAALAE
jgi:hypothetical protein